MARLWTTGFETGTTEWNGGNSGASAPVTVTSSIKRTGTYSANLLAAGIGAYIRQIFDANEAELYGRFALRLDSVASARTFTLVEFRDSNNAIQFQLDYNGGTGTLDWYDNTTNELATGFVVIPADSWVVVEFHVQVSALGTLVAKINGTTCAGYGGNTDFTGATNVRSLYFRLESGPGTGSIYLDDIAINDTEGSYQTTYPGLGGVFYLEPTADGDQTDWTPSTGTVNYAMVDDIPPDDATTYNQAVTTGAIDLYEVDDCPEYVAAVNLVQVVYRATLTTSGYNEITDLVKVSGTVYSGNENVVVPITPTFGYYLGTVHYLNPATGTVWGTAEVNAMQAGMEITA